MGSILNYLTSRFFLKSLFRVLLPILFLVMMYLMIVFWVVIPLLEKTFMKERQDMSRRLLEVLVSDLDARYQEGLIDNLDMESIRRRVIWRYERLRFGVDNKDYFWIISTEPRMIMHPYAKHYVNADPVTTSGPDNKPLIHLLSQMVEVCRNPEGGFIEYLWFFKDRPDMVTWKMSYVRPFEPWGWIIGTGVYLEDIRHDIASWRQRLVWIGLLLASITILLYFVLTFQATRSQLREHIAVQNLRERENNFRTIFETSPFPITINRLSDGRYLKVNAAYRQFSGYSEEELLKITIHDVSGEAMNGFNQQMTEKLQSVGRLEQEHVTIHNRTGEEKEIIFSSTIMDYNQERCIMSIIVDVTEFKRLESQLRQSQKMDMIGQLAGGIAHDFNNMLAGILGFAEILEISLEENSKPIEYTRAIIEGCKKAADLTQKLLVFSRKATVLNIRSDVHDSIRSTIALLKRTIDPRITIQARLTAVKSHFIGDSSMIENALLNLAINARDAMPEGGLLTFTTTTIQLDEYFCHIHANGIDPGEYIEIDVSDTGVGISKQDLNRIFEPFFTTKPVGKGTGLGLSAVFGTITQHHGLITVYSELGMGSVFKIYLPVADPKPEKPEEVETMEVVPGHGTIMVVDDEVIIQNMTRQFLTKLGYKVILARDGEEAVKLFSLQGHLIDLILLDMVMPKMSGQEVFQQIRSLNPKMKIIFSSGYNPEQNHHRDLENRADGFIRKPYRIAELSRIIAQVLNRPS